MDEMYRSPLQQAATYLGFSRVPHQRLTAMEAMVGAIFGAVAVFVAAGFGLGYWALLPGVATIAASNAALVSMRLQAERER